jgi:hypothetical protein
MRDDDEGGQNRADSRAEVAADLKTDCARPCRPPDESRATREDSGWKIDEPMPIIAAASSSIGKLPACDSITSPSIVKPMPIASE